jgi:VanZ family protein
LEFIGASVFARVLLLESYRAKLETFFMRRFLKFWLPVLIWMSVIFTASADSKSYQHSSLLVEPLLRWLFPHMPEQEIAEIHHIFRKCCHLAEYSVLGLLVFRALSYAKTELSPWSWPRVGGALLIVFLYASSDEYHQRFVPTRTPLFSDVCIDTAGGAIGLLLAWLCHSFRPSKSPPPK